MDLLFESKTESAIDISDVIIKEEPLQHEENSEIYNNEFINIIKSEASEDAIEGIDTIEVEVSSSFLDPLIQDTLEDFDPDNTNEDAQEFILRKEGGRIRRRRLIACPICKKKYIKSYMKEHMRTHPQHTHGDIKVEDDDEDTNDSEDEDEEDSNDYVTHKDGRRHKLVECPVCQRRYIQSYIKHHLRTHERKKQDKSQLEFNERYKALVNANNVNANAAASKDLREFVIHKSGDRTRKHPLLTCPICKKRYINKYMKTHLKTHAENPEDKPQTKQVECKVCKKILSVQALTAHMRIHTGEKPFVCPICGWQFRKADRLKEHEMTHSGARPFVCTHCKKGFKRKSYLREHVRIHTGEKPLSCKICDKKFGFAHTLSMHMKIHNNDKRFICSICNKACITKSNLAIHMVTHTKERNYECTACGFKFGRAANLHTHVMRWCKGEPKKTKSKVDKLNE